MYCCYFISILLRRTLSFWFNFGKSDDIIIIIIIFSAWYFLSFSSSNSSRHSFNAILVNQFHSLLFLFTHYGLICVDFDMNRIFMPQRRYIYIMYLKILRTNFSQWFLAKYDTYRDGSNRNEARLDILIISIIFNYLNRIFYIMLLMEIFYLLK